MKERKNKVKTFFSFLKEAHKDPKKRIIVFFVFYFIFFAVLITLLRLNSGNNNNQIFINKDYSINKIESNNYHYIYNINYNDEIITIDGEKYNDIENFVIKENNTMSNYFKNSKGYLKKESDKWIKVTDPNNFSYITNIDSIKNILDSATYISKQDNKTIEYHISTTTLVKIIDGKNIDIDDLPNKIILKVDNYKEVEEIELDLSPYLTYTNGKDSKLIINTYYDSFNNIEEIYNPSE